MGVPKFFRYVSERYPCILEMIKENQDLEFDNLYLDMNGIFHSCSHSNDEANVVNLSEKDIFSNIFHYIDMLFYLVQPKKLLFMAVDGVAPRAKMNQQRSRRFRTAKAKELLENKLKLEGKILPDTPRFDSNCITPGTQFMVQLQVQLEYYIASRISTNPLWRKCKVLLSGHQVPGEGEHKIVEYIRYLKGLPDYDPNLRHCLYGMDADLVMLGLCTHEKNISILREEVVFGRKSATASAPEKVKFCLLHLCLLKEYLDLEFQELKNVLEFEYNLENILDDWVLMGFLLGNDFIPHLPDFHISKGAIPALYSTYMEVLPKLGGYLNEGGHLNLSRFQVFMETLAKHELRAFEETYADMQYFAEKTDNRSNFEKGEDKRDESKNFQLDALTNVIDKLNTSEEELIDNYSEPESESEEEDDEEMFLEEFCQFKRNYYMQKLDYSEVTEEILQSQAECYIRGLQWILHYYYHGCASWSWCYPHHYAPCTSDVVNFKNVSLDFELGEPILPYQQLLAILPPASKDLLPKAYHSLMISPKSPVKEYYPDNFETDLNGKQHDWEAVVLLPIIDISKLLKAMKEYDSYLTQEEVQNNRHGPMLCYTYKCEDLGFYKAPKYFIDIQTNHALVEKMWKNEITSSANKFKLCDSKRNPNIYFSGFPTFRFVQFEASKKNAGIRIFNQATKSDSIVLTIKQEEFREPEVLAHELLDKTVFVKWPFLTEARTVALADVEYMYYISNKLIKKEKHSTAAALLEWRRNSTNWSRLYKEKFGINIGEITVMVYAKILKGMIFNPGNKGEMGYSKVWSDDVELYPLQTVVKDIELYRSPDKIGKQENMFSVGSAVFTLTPLNYGAMGKIVKFLDQASSRVKVEVELLEDYNIDWKKLKQSKTSYHTAYFAAQLIGISESVVSRISGSIFVDKLDNNEMCSRKSIVNIGLGLKFNKSQEEIPGYTKKGSCWLYSSKAIDIMKEYVMKFPNVIKYLCSRWKEGNTFEKLAIFSDPEAFEEIPKLVEWIKGLECSQLKRVPCGSQILEKDIILELQEMVDNSPKCASLSCVIARIDQLFKSDLITSGLPPVPEAEHRLFDRVIAVKPHQAVPLGLRGYIIGIYHADNKKDISYDILYDTSFRSGTILNSSSERVHKTTETSFINISHGERLYQSKNSFKKSRIQSAAANSRRLQVADYPPSNSAEGNLSSPSVSSSNKEICYGEIWRLLENDKSQDETTILKKILQIEEQKPKIEENVKSFFESLSKNPANNFVNKQNLSRNEAKNRLLHYLKDRNMPPPKYVFNKTSCGQIICKIQLNNQKEYIGLPSMDQLTASESAAGIAFACITSPQENSVYLSNNVAGKKQEENQKITDSQDKLLRCLHKESFQTKNNSEPVKCIIKPRCSNDMFNRSSQVNYQNHHRKNVPEALPTPPPQWCHQYKNFHREQKKTCHLEERKSNSDPRRIEHSDRQRYHNENQNNWGHSRIETQIKTHRNLQWRQQEEGMISFNSGNRPGRELTFSPFTHGKEWKHRTADGDFSQNDHMRLDLQYSRQQNGYAQRRFTNYQVQDHNPCQKRTAITSEFIPLQVLTRNRQRTPGPSAITPVQSEKLKNEMQHQGTSAIPAAISVANESTKEMTKLSVRQRRETKIAAKFDAAWDLQG